MEEQVRVPVSTALQTKIETSLIQKGPSLPGGKRRLDEKLVKSIKEFRVEIWPNESQHRGRPHCKVTTDKGSATFDFATGEKLAGSAGHWDASISKVLPNYLAELMKVWNETRPDDQKLPPSASAPKGENALGSGEKGKRK